MTIDDKIEKDVQYPLFIKHKDFRFSDEESYFYFVGEMKGLGDNYIMFYNSDKSESTYSYKSIMKDINKKLRL